MNPAVKPTHRGWISVRGWVTGQGRVMVTATGLGLAWAMGEGVTALN